MIGGLKKLSAAFFHDQWDPEGSPTGKWDVILPGAPYIKKPHQFLVGLFCIFPVGLAHHSDCRVGTGKLYTGLLFEFGFIDRLLDTQTNIVLS